VFYVSLLTIPICCQRQVLNAISLLHHPLVGDHILVNQYVSSLIASREHTSDCALTSHVEPLAGEAHQHTLWRVASSFRAGRVVRPHLASWRTGIT
jgi:hypothetical protein